MPTATGPLRLSTVFTTWAQPMLFAASTRPFVRLTANGWCREDVVADLVARFLQSAFVGCARSCCAQVVKTVDNLNGPVAVGNVKTLLNEGIDGFVDFQVLAAYQPAIAKLLKSAKVPTVTVVGATLPGSRGRPGAVRDRDNAAMGMAKWRRRGSRERSCFLGGAEPTSGPAVVARCVGASPGRDGLSQGYRRATSSRGRPRGSRQRRTTPRCRRSRRCRASARLMQAVNNGSSAGCARPLRADT